MLQVASWSADTPEQRETALAMFAADGPELLERAADNPERRYYGEMFIADALRQLGRFDEANRIVELGDYGWPTYSFGREYDGSDATELPFGPGTEEPAVVWLPSIAPSGLMFYTGDAFPQWQGNMFVGSARWGEINGTGSLQRVVFNEDFGELRREALLADLHQRVRDVKQGPDGLIYVLTDGPENAVLRIAPSR